jgi:Hypothetical methyltransferase/short chain dehydrogenase
MGSNNKQQFKGAFLFTKAVLPYMISNGSGVILNVNSGAGKAGFGNLSAYCASKFGLVGLAESLALEVSEYANIRVLTLFLGEVATKMWQEYDFRYYQKNKSKMLQPKDVAEKIAEMIFDTKKYKNGPQRVCSFDHVAINDKVTACDMKKVPLADEALDVAIFSLYLMGKNWHEYINEAKRCLVTNGILIIAETTKSLKGRLSNLRDEIQNKALTYIQMKKEEILHLLKLGNYSDVIQLKR